MFANGVGRCAGRGGVRACFAARRQRIPSHARRSAQQRHSVCGQTACVAATHAIRTGSVTCWYHSLQCIVALLTTVSFHSGAGAPQGYRGPAQHQQQPAFQPGARPPSSFQPSQQHHQPSRQHQQQQQQQQQHRGYSAQYGGYNPTHANAPPPSNVPQRSYGIFRYFKHKINNFF